MTSQTADPVANWSRARRKIGKQRARKLRRRGEQVWYSAELQSRVWIKRTDDGRRCECGYGCPSFQGCRHD